uniref:Uncharacterized protein n=1 Tax=Arundo donax TaxID=35708 RepID=A0A0A9BTM0_ARUDO
MLMLSLAFVFCRYNITEERSFFLLHIYFVCENFKH